MSCAVKILSLESLFFAEEKILLTCPDAESASFADVCPICSHSSSNYRTAAYIKNTLRLLLCILNGLVKPRFINSSLYFHFNIIQAVQRGKNWSESTNTSSVPGLGKEWM